MSHLDQPDIASLKLVQDILGAVSEQVIILNREGIIRWGNQSWIDSGIKGGDDPDQDWIGTDYFKLARKRYGFSEETHQKAFRGISDVLSGKQHHSEIDYPCNGPDETGWFRLQVNGFQQEEESGAILIQSDISGQKRVELSREHTKQVFQDSFEKAAVGIAHISPEGSYIRLNKHFSEIIGYSAAEMVGKTFQSITHPDDLGEDLDLIRQMLKGKINTYTLEKRYIHKNGAIVWVSLTATLIRLKSGEPDYFIAVVKDISERRLIQQKLTRQRIVLEEAQRLARTGSWTWEFETDTIEWSGTLYEIMGMDPHTLLPPPGEHQIFYDKEGWLKHNALVEESIRSGKTYSAEIDMIREDGTVCHTITRGVVVKDPSGQLTRLFGTVQDISERKQAEKALKDQEDSYRSLFEQAKDGIVLIQDDKVAYTNMALTELTGYSADEMRGTPFIDFLEKDQVTRVKQFYSSRMRGQSAPSIYESALTHKEGHRLDVEFNAGLSILNGLSTDIVIVRDISVRKQEQQKLEESESRFRALYDHAGFALGMAKGSSGVNELVNQAWLDLFGYSDASEVIGESAMDCVVPEDRAQVAKYAQLRSEGKEAPLSYEIRGLRKDGTTFDMEMRLSSYTYEDELHSIAMITDITDRKKAQAERDRFFNLSSDLITISGFDNYFKQLNPAWERVTGYKINELLERPFLSLIHPDDRQKTVEEVEKLSKGIPTVQFENRHITSEGEVRYFSWKATPLVEKELIYAIARDVTESKEAEDQILMYQQRLKDLGIELTLSEERQRRQIASDLHDHVGQLIASSRLQLAAIHDGVEKTEILSRIREVSKGLLAAIQATRNAIFDLSPPQLKEIGLFAATADWLEEQVETKYGIDTRITGEDRKFPLNDNIQLLLFRCIRELLMNVAKHSGASSVHVDLIQVGAQLKITVQDNGKGFRYNPDLIRLKSTGFGLLSIMERLEDLGGHMEINSTIGEGSEVIMWLPLNELQV